MKKHFGKFAVLIAAVAAVLLWRGSASPDVQLDVELNTVDVSVILEQCDTYIQNSDFSQGTKDRYDPSEYRISQITQPMLDAVVPEGGQEIPTDCLVVVFPNQNRPEVPAITLVLDPDTYVVLGMIPAI